MGTRMNFLTALTMLSVSHQALSAGTADDATIRWGATALIHNEPIFGDAGSDARKLSPGHVGSQFPRLVQLDNGAWLASYMTSDNDGYTRDPTGGTALQISQSTDDGRHWAIVGTLRETGRDLDNGRMIQRPDGTLLLAYRSVRWGESYRILVRTSSDLGRSWSSPAVVDSSESRPGGLSHPDRGLYEPDMHILPNGDIAMMYANEKYALASPAYSQVISMRISTDGGKHWGPETIPVRDMNNPASRPGMPIWSRMADGRYILVYELCGSDACNAWVKVSADPRHWSTDLGTRIPGQVGAPYVLSLSDGRLMVTSNTHAISISEDLGRSWRMEKSQPWSSKEQGGNLWPALIQTRPNEVAAVTSAGRPPFQKNGNNIQIKFGEITVFTGLR